MQEVALNDELSPELSLIEKARQRLAQKQFYIRLFRAPIDRIRWVFIHRKIHLLARKLRTNFFVVQIGANDGIHSDPIRSFINKYGWHGVLVEPVPHYFKKLIKNYKDSPNLSFVETAITNTDGEATMYSAVDLGDGITNPLQGKDSISRDLIVGRAWMSKWPVEALVKPLRVPTMKLQTLLDTNRVSRLDMIVVDAEGQDKIILYQLYLNRYQPTFILYEHLHLSKKECMLVADRLENHGYKLIVTRRDTFAEFKTHL